MWYLLVICFTNPITRANPSAMPIDSQTDLTNYKLKQKVLILVSCWIQTIEKNKINHIIWNPNWILITTTYIVLHTDVTISHMYGLQDE